MPKMTPDRATGALIKIQAARMEALRQFEEADQKLQAAAEAAVSAITQPKDFDGDSLTKAYLCMRDDKHALGRCAERLDTSMKEQMARIEVALLGRLLSNNAQSMKTGHGTFYKEEVMRPACNDWPAFYKFIAENDCFEAMEKRVTKDFIKKYSDEHNELPPGITVHREAVVRVRTTNKG